MKRIFTLVALLAISANLALANYTYGGVALKPQKASPFECDEHTENAETKTYSTQTMKNDMGVISMHDGQILKVCFFDDGTVWFHNPFFLNSNSFPEKQKLIGTIDETGLITIPMHQIVYSFNDDVSGEQRDVKVSRCTIENDEYGRAVRISDYNKNVVGFEYGKKGEKKAVVYPDGEKVDFRHDEYGRLIQVDTSAGVINYIYDNSGQIKKKRFPGNVWVDYTYDRAGRVSEFTSTDATGAVDKFMYEYDAVGNKVRICKRRRGMSALSGDYRYSYDSLNRLIEVEKDGKLLRSYSYDGYGNRTYMSEEGEEFFILTMY